MHDVNMVALSEYNQWANKTLLEALKKMPPEELTRPRVSLFKDLCHTLNHMLVIGRIWKGHLQGVDHGYTSRNTQDYPDFPILSSQLQDIDQWYVQWAKETQQNDLQKVISFSYVNGQPGKMMAAQMLQHVVMHNSYHRGYIGDFMFQVEGCRAPQMDFSVYCTDVLNSAQVQYEGFNSLFVCQP